MDALQDFRFIVYGPPGVGKSVLSYTAVDDPRLSPVLALDCEGRIGSVRSKARQIDFADMGHPVAGKADVVRVTTWKEAVAVLGVLTGRKEHPYKCAILDNMTELNYYCLSHVLAEDGRPTSGLLSVRQPERMHYLQSGFIFKNFVRELRDKVKIAVIMTAWPAWPSDSEPSANSIKMLKPSLVGKLKDEVCGLSDFVGWLEVKKDKKRVLKLAESLTIYAKFGEEGNEPDPIENPTMTKVLDLLGGKQCQNV